MLPGTRMDAEMIIAKARERRDKFREAAAFGTASDPLVASAAQVCWDIAEEYESLLAEITAIPPEQV